jgi:transcriptional regulator with XRE-family HTH domain
MIDRFANAEDDADLPHAPLDLSTRIRELRTRQGLKQSEVARRMGLDPSIPSLWEQGKRLVPANRVRALADALGVSVAELLQEASGAPKPVVPVADGRARHGPADLAAMTRALRDRPAGQHSPLLTLVSAQDSAPVAPGPQSEPQPPVAPVPAPRPFVPAARPVLTGWIPEGWAPDERIQDINPALPDGYWLDPVRLEKQTAKLLLRSRLCPADQALIGDREVPGTAMAERIYRHCCRQEGYAAGRLPLIEAIFRAVLAAEDAGLSVDGLAESLGERAGAVPITRTLLRRLRDSVRPYPLRWVDRELFG